MTQRELPLLFTPQMWRSAIAGNKTQTRRLSCRYRVGDLCYLPEPTHVLHMGEGSKVLVEWLWSRESAWVPVTEQDIERLESRKDWSRPAISRFMLKSFARYWVEVTEVREEQLQSISEADARAEGVECVIASRERFGCRAAGMWLYRDYADKREPWQRGYDTAIGSYASLWDSINADKNPWASNPWVWIVSFQRVASQVEAQQLAEVK